MSEKRDPNDPSNVTAAYEVMTPRWEVINTLLGGTEAMRDAGESYLPRHMEESDDDYTERLMTNVLFNATEQTLDTLTGKPFSDPVKLNDDVPKEIAELAEDIDLQGNNMDVFGRKWFRDGIAKGFSHVMVDFPRRFDPEDGRPRTLADDRNERLRPYWVHLPPENVLAMHAEVVNGAEKLTHARILEVERVRVGFLEHFVKRIRVLEPGFVQIWELRKDPKTKKEQWVVVDEFATDLDEIPIVTFYTDKQDVGLAKPPLLDLAHLNVRHWQSTSDQINILTVARFPILAVAGLDEDEASKMQVGPRAYLSTPDPTGKYYYVEHAGHAISAGAEDLRELEEQMISYGGQFLKRQPGNVTATQRALDSAESLSVLQAWTVSFEDSMSRALDLTAKWLRLGNEGGTVELNRTAGLEDTDDEASKILIKTRELRDISRVAYLNELVRRGILDEDFDPEEDMELLEEEAKQGMGLGQAGIDIDPNAPDPEEEDDEEGEDGPDAGNAPSS